MTIDQIITLIGLILTFSSGILIALISSGYFKRNKEEKINKISMTCGKDPLELCNDYVFIKLDNLYRDINTHFHMENKGKELILKMIMGTKISASRDDLYDLCLDIDKKIRNGIEITEEDLFKMNMEVFDKTFNKYTEFYKNNLMFSEEEIKVLDIFMDKFNIWHSGNISSFIISITDACQNKYVQDIRMKQSIINSAYLHSMNSMFKDAENTADSINGSLSGLKFREVVL